MTLEHCSLADLSHAAQLQHPPAHDADSDPSDEDSFPSSVCRLYFAAVRADWVPARFAVCVQSYDR